MRFVMLLLCTACAGIVPMEEHGGAAPIPSKVPDVAFATAGAAFDMSLAALHVPTIPRAALDATAAYCVRSCKFLGRTVDSGFMFAIGTYPPNFVRFIVHAKRLHRACQIAGADGVVHEGRMDRDECRPVESS